jgi:flagellar biosynthesis protein FlhF
MVIRKFYGKNMKMVLQQAKAALGEDVVILSQATLEDATVELTAAVEPVQGPGRATRVGLEEEILEIKRMLLSVLEEREISRLGKAALVLYQELKGKGLSERTALEVVQDLAAGVSPDELCKKEVMHREFRRFFSGRIQTTQGLPKGKSCIALLGRTGVGKTTTLAKLASMERFLHRRNVAVVSLDGEKVAAREELQRIGSLLEIPVGVAHERNQISRLLEIRDKVDTLFVDTPGKGLQDKGMRESLFDVISLCPDTEFHLLLSPHYRTEVLAQDLEEYGRLSLASLILTKLDESRCVGGLLDVLLCHPVPLSWMTTGQDIPHDIVPANKGLLLDMMLEA